VPAGDFGTMKDFFTTKLIFRRACCPFFLNTAFAIRVEIGSGCKLTVSSFLKIARFHFEPGASMAFCCFIIASAAAWRSIPSAKPDGAVLANSKVRCHAVIQQHVDTHVSS
jgi:hypothetical protein